MSPTEFVSGWTQTYNMGSEDEAQTLFTRADTNDDGYLDIQDVPTIFSYFDVNGKYTQWSKVPPPHQMATDSICAKFGGGRSPIFTQRKYYLSHLA